MGSQTSSLALSAQNAGVSSTPPCCARYHHSQHMAAAPYTLFREKRAAQRTRFFTGNNAVDAGAAGAALGVATQYFANQIFNPCTRGGTRGGNKKTNNKLGCAGVKLRVKFEFLVQKNVRSKKCSVQKSFGSKKILGPKKFWVQKIFWSKQIFGPKQSWVQ